MSSKTAHSKRELARELGKSEASVRKWVKDDRWPFEKVGPWDIAKVRKWALKTMAPDPSEPSRLGERVTLNRKAAAAAKPPACAVETEEDPEPELPHLGTGDASEERVVNIQLKRERMETARWNRERDQAKYVLKSEVQQRWQRLAHEIKTELLNLPDATVPAMQGLSEAEQRDVLRGRILEVLRNLSGEEKTNAT